MRSALPKVLHPLLGRTLARACAARRRSRWRPPRRWSWSATARTQVSAHVAEIAPEAQPVLQARAAAAPGTPSGSRWTRLPDVTGTVVVVLYGDTPLLRAETLQALLATHAASRRGRDRADRAGGRPDRARPDRARRRRAARRASSSSGTRRRSSGAITRDQRRDLRVRRGRAARCARQAVPPTTPRARSTSPTCIGLLRRRRPRGRRVRGRRTPTRRSAATTGPSSRRSPRCCGTGSTAS